MKRTTLLSAATPLAVAAAAILAVGDLNPPAGAVAATGKRLTEIEPRIPISATTTPGDADSLFKITQPGSYYLTGNVGGVINKHGIEITASGVTVDLNGFDLLGVAGSLDGVSAVVGGLRGIAVINGSIRSWGGNGINVLAEGSHVERASVSGNGGTGVRLTSNNRIADCTVALNGSHGIYTGSNCTISNCSAKQNGGSGFNAGDANTISYCTASVNVGGFNVSFYCTVADCAAYFNTGTGIAAQGGSVISNCTASQNTGDGFSAAFNVTVSNCSARGNSGDGIRVLDGCSVIDCGTRGNTLDGIRCASNCLIRGNNCSFNGDVGGDGANIHATSSDNRIEGNSCTSADRGIDVDVSGNIIIRNTCSGNTTNWDVVSANTCLVVQAVSALAILGNSGGAAPGSTDPNANFTY